MEVVFPANLMQQGSMIPRADGREDLVAQDGEGERIEQQQQRTCRPAASKGSEPMHRNSRGRVAPTGLGGSWSFIAMNRRARRK